MKWPFVARSLHDDVVADLRRRLDDAEADRRKLTRTVVRMKVAGGSIPRPPAGYKEPARETDALDRALDENPIIARTPGLRRQQRAWAEKQLELGADVETILDRIAALGTVSVDADDEDDDSDALVS